MRKRNTHPTKTTTHRIEGKYLANLELDVFAKLALVEA